MPYGTLLTDVVQSSTAGTPPQFNDGNSVQVGTLCRAWVYFVTAGTITRSFNVSSVTKNSTGNWSVNFSTAFSAAPAAVCAADAASNVIGPYVGSTSTTSLVIQTKNTGGAAVDTAVVYCACFS
jgi:hypothetical protein